MEYTVNRLAGLAGVSARTIRFYDEIGLLRPARTTGAGYRIYGGEQVDTLQQILFFRAMGLPLETIRAILSDAAFDRRGALQSHLAALRKEQARLDRLILTVEKTIEKEEGRRTMTDKEKFEGLKQRLVDENEARYGEEIREAYSEETVDESNRKLLNMDKGQFDRMQQDAQDILTLLKEAVQGGAKPDGDAGQRLAALHKKWLGYSWPRYAKEAHLGLVQMYLADERFAAYYDGAVPGGAQFLHDAVTAWIDAI